MSRDGAMARARALRDELTKRGVPTSIEIQQGRPGTPNGRWFDTRFIGTMGHHIVSRRSQGLTPGLALVKRGRSDVPGPLCNGYLGFDGRARIICMGWANHPGAGGAYTLPGGRIPQNTGRPYLFGWEIEGGLSESDWPASFRTLMGKVHAATLAWLGRDERSHIEHKTWAPSRKIDRLGYTLASARAEVRRNSTSEDDMPLNDADKKWLESNIGAPVRSARAAVRDHLRWVATGDGTTTFSPRTFWDLTARDSRRSALRTDEILANQEAADAKLDSILAAAGGSDGDEIKALIQQNHADTVARLEAADVERDQLREQVSQIAELVEQVGSGELAADEVVRLIGERLTATDDDGEA